MSMQERPERPPRSKPVPSPDAGVDPIDFRPPATDATTQANVQDATSLSTASAVAPAVPRKQSRTTQAPAQATATPLPITSRSEVTVQLSTRVSLDVEAILAEAAARTGKKKRALVEEAIIAKWGSKR